jgi:hypothetical protein
MPINTLYAAESWEKIYKAFETINFVSYDYDTVKQSLLDYLKFYYPEQFNDFIESSQLIALVEVFAYVSEQLAYRVDMAAHENFITTAERKQSILRLAKLISYTSTRNIALRGFVKLTSVSTSETVRDSQGNNLTNRVITWNDPNNPLWKEQFFLVMNKLLVKPFGNPSKSFQIDDTIFQQYEINNNLKNNTFENGTLTFSVNVGTDKVRFEIVPSDVDESGVFERAPSDQEHFTILYSDDGFGDGSPTTGFLMFIKQGQLTKLPYNFSSPLPNRVLDVDVANINDTDVWVQEVDALGNVLDTWEVVPTVNAQNIFFNSLKNPKKYEVQSLEADKVRVIFGDGDFATMPVGQFNIWVRSSANRSDIIVQKSKIVNETTTFGYTSKLGTRESTTLRFSLTSTLQNAAESEDIEHIRTAAPATYYTQNRMVNGQDYNTFLLQDPTILRLKAINRTFAGQPKYITWNDPSGQYQNVKLFGNDLRIYQDFSSKTIKQSFSPRELIDKILEPLLKSPEILNTLIYVQANSKSPWKDAFILPRTTFIEDATLIVNGIKVQEKTEIQGSIDRHWYGEPDEIITWPVTLNKNDMSNPSVIKQSFGLVINDTDQLVYDINLELLKLNPGLAESGLDPANYPYVRVNKTANNRSGFQDAASRYKRFGIRYTNDRNMVGSASLGYGIQSFEVNQATAQLGETWTAQLISDDGTFLVFGTKSGLQPPAKAGTLYDNGIVKFLIKENPLVPYVLGDTFVITLKAELGIQVDTIQGINVAGRFEVIPESSIQDTTLTSPFDPNDPVNSWIFIIERSETDEGVFLHWNISYRDLRLVAESDTTRFWFNADMFLTDSDTKKRVRDVIKVLKSNLNATRTLALGVDSTYDVVGDVKYDDGEVNIHSLAVTPSDSTNTYYSGDGYPDNPMQFQEFLATTDYVYFQKEASTGRLIPIESTPYVQGLTYQPDNQNNEISGSYVRKRGRDKLDFLWQHFTPNNNLIDPSVSNIIDIYVMTRGYYANVLNYLRGVYSTAPIPPTPLELRNNYRDLLQNKMISDTVVMRHGKFKLLFGNLAEPELRGTFKVIKSRASKVTSDQLKIKIIDIINEYFRIENWDFAKSFYVTELLAVIHKKLATDIDTVVLVPTFPSNYFGSLFSVNSADDEILISAATIDDVEIVSTLDKLTIKQKS